MCLEHQYRCVCYTGAFDIRINIFKHTCHRARSYIRSLVINVGSQGLAGLLGGSAKKKMDSMCCLACGVILDIRRDRGVVCVFNIF